MALSMENYVVASCKEWHFPGFQKLQKKLTGNWHWVATTCALEDLLVDIKPRFIFFLHWNWLVPENIWKNYECVCFHMTDVPYGRGGSPLQNLIVRGHKVTQLTALRMVKEVDVGPVYTKRSLSLEGTAYDIYLRAGELSFEIIQWMIKSQPQPTPQKGDPVIFKRRKPEQSRLQKSGEMTELYDHIRMLDAPTYPSAFIEYGEFVIEFTGAKIHDDELSATVQIRKKS